MQFRLVLLCFAFLTSVSRIQALSSVVSAPALPDRAPSWSILQDRLLATPTGRRLWEEASQRQQELGVGPPHTDATIRLFRSLDSDNGTVVPNPRIVFYRDASGWCPYCQRVWIFLEEKKLPYRVVKIPLNAYGDKPAWFTRKVDGGKLPAIELDGELHVESQDVMRLLEDTFGDDHGTVSLVPKNEKERIEKLTQLESDLQRVWFSLVFYPIEGEVLENAKTNLMAALHRVDAALNEFAGPWFLLSDLPTLVDIRFITTMERLIASVLYFKGIRIRDGSYPHIDRWLEAMEARPSYAATKADYYSIVRALPSQNGPGYGTPEAREIADQICGLRGAWNLPLKDEIEPIPPAPSEESARLEAALALISNHEKAVEFACRGSGEPGRPSFHAELADPYAEPNLDFAQPVDVCLRYVTAMLLLLEGEKDNVETTEYNDDADEVEFARIDLAGMGGDGTLREGWGAYQDEAIDGGWYYWNDMTGEVTWSAPTQQLDTCLVYLRDRIGVPRDMGIAAARQLRAHLNCVVDFLQ